MFWVLLAIGVILSILLSIQLSDRDGYAIGVLLGGWVVTAFGLFLFVMVAFSIGYIAPSGTVSSGKLPLSAMGNAQGMKGSMYRGFFITTGQIEDTQIIQYVTKHKDGYSQIKKASAESSRIYTDEEKNPYYVRVYETYGMPEWAGLDWIEHSGSKKLTHIEFHVPKNSIANEYEIDVTK